MLYLPLPTLKCLSLFLKAQALFFCCWIFTSAYADTCSPLAGGQYIRHGGFVTGNNTAAVTNQTPIGAVIWQGTSWVHLDCSRMAISTVSLWNNGPLVSGYSDIFPIREIKGVGLRVRFDNFNDGYGNSIPGNLPGEVNFFYQDRFGPKIQATAVVQLIKIAPEVGAGQLNQNSATKGFIINYTTPSDDTPVSFQYHFSNVNITPTAACTITTPSSMVIQMNKVDARTVKNSAAPTVDFSVGFNCSSSTRIQVAVSDINSNASTNVLTLTPSLRNARGVGIELRNAQDQPITLNQKWIANSFANGALSILFKARYVKTDELVIAGQANAMATLTFDFL